MSAENFVDVSTLVPPVAAVNQPLNAKPNVVHLAPGKLPIALPDAIDNLASRNDELPADHLPA